MGESITIAGCETILFDLDDTLIGSERIYHEVYQELGLEPSVFDKARAAVKQQLGHGHVAARNRMLYFKKYLELRHEFSSSGLLKLSHAYEELLAQKILEELQITKHREVLRTLSQHYTLGIVTNENLRTQMLKLNQLDPNNELFAFVITSEEMGVEKPEPAIVERALAMSGAAVDKIVMVGDSINNDLEPFAKKGCQVLGTTQFRNEATKANPYRWIESLEELVGG